MRRILGLGDSLMCGLVGYDLDPAASFFGLLARGLGEALGAPKVTWNVAPFERAITLPPGSEEFRATLARLAAGAVAATAAPAPRAGALAAAPGFSSWAYLHCHEGSPALPDHLRSLAGAFLNPAGAAPRPAFAQALERGPAEIVVVWLGGVDWITAFLSRRRRPRALRPLLLRQMRTLLRRLAAAPAAAAVPPLLLVGGIVDPTRLPLTVPDGAGFRMAFRRAEEASHPCDRMTADEWHGFSREVQAANRDLAALTREAGGRFVDFDGLLARVQERGRLGEVPAAALLSGDLVHPSRAGHTFLAHALAAEIERQRGIRVPLPTVEEVWRRERLAAPVDPESWRLLVGCLYERYLYRAEPERSTASWPPAEARREGRIGLAP
jgi:lysophospholipase L1-like esterase